MARKRINKAVISKDAADRVIDLTACDAFDGKRLNWLDPCYIRGANGSAGCAISAGVRGETCK